MNLRTLKKFSKRAAPLLRLIGDNRQQFPATKSDCYHNCGNGFPRKNWERHSCHPTHHGFAGQIRFTSRAGRPMVMQAPSHPLKGTVMVGAMSGYYGPEWGEETAWDSLRSYVCAFFTDWSGRVPSPTRDIRTPTDIFKAAADIIAEPSHDR